MDSSTRHNAYVKRPEGDAPPPGMGPEAAAEVDGGRLSGLDWSPRSHRVEPRSSGREGSAAVAAPLSLTTGGVPSAQALVAALAEVGDRAIGGAEVFGTFTFRDPPPRPGSPHFTSIGHGGGVRAIEKYLADLADVYPDVAAFVAMEPHADRVAPHFHGLLSGLGPEVAAAVDAGRRGRVTATGSVGARHARALLWERWWTDHGMARLEAVRGGNGSALYVAKYSLKRGDDVPWWRVWEPGELRNAWVASTHRRRRK